MRVKKHFETRPWGDFEAFTPTKKPSSFESVKIITVNPKSELSLQYHEKRDEFMKIIKGKCVIRIGDEFFKAKTDDEFFIPKKKLHHIKTGKEGVQILEISFDKFDEKDIVRISDKYGRK